MTSSSAHREPGHRGHRVLWSLLGLGTLLSACGGASSAGTTPDAVRFARPTGTLQCEASRLTMAERLRAQAAIEGAGIRVQALACGHDGRARITVCGAEAGELLVADVQPGPSGASTTSEVSARMKSLGFQPWSTWPDAVTQACPPG